MLNVKGIEIGSGMPKICVPITSRTKQDIIEEIICIRSEEIDLIEWRVDFFDEVEKINSVLEVLEELVKVNSIPLLFTFRTKKEGGNKEVSIEYYFQLNKAIAESKLINIIDIELHIGEAYTKNLIDISQKNGIFTIISNHDFEKTPSKEELVVRMKKMQDIGGDIAKIAVMPNSVSDVINLLDVTSEMSKELIIPIVTMSMSDKGLISRLVGESIGSSITFGTVGKPSAPGQIPVKELKGVLEVIHKYT